MAEPVYEGQNYTRITTATTTIVSSGPCTLLGIFVSAASATPTITVLDGSVTTDGAFTPVGGVFYPIPHKTRTSLIIVTTGTVDISVKWGT